MLSPNDNPGTPRQNQIFPSALLNVHSTQQQYRKYSKTENAEENALISIIIKSVISQ